MASQIVISVPCEEYLIRFLEKMYGPSPISFPKKSNFNTLLDVFLDRPPMNHTPVTPEDPGKFLQVELPYFEQKDIRSYNYLTAKMERAFVKEIWKFFKITFRGEIAQLLVLGLDRKDALEIFMEKYNLPQDCWDALEKDFQRYLKLRSKKKRLFKPSLNSAERQPACPATS